MNICLQIPLVPSIIYLSIPHLGIGAGIGSVDAALVPLLATLADSIADDTNPSVSNTATYGRTFAIGQTAVGLAYCFGKQFCIITNCYMMNIMCTNIKFELEDGYTKR